MKTSKLAKRKKNYSLVQVVHQLKLFVLLSSFCAPHDSHHCNLTGRGCEMGSGAPARCQCL